MANLSNLSKLAASLAKAASSGGDKKSYTDARIYKPVANASGQFSAIIRFVSPPDENSDPIVSNYSHVFNGSNGFYHELCPTTIAGECPVCTKNRADWATKDDYTINQAKPRSRKQKFYTNILVIKDTVTPENNGKTFIYSCDKKIFDKIVARCSEVEGSLDTPIDVYSAIDGASFKLIGASKTLNLSGKDVTFLNFDSSSFSDPSPLSKDQIALIEGKTFDLSEFTDPSKFKSFPELTERMNKVLGSVDGVISTIAPAGSVIEDEEEDPVAKAFDTPPAKKAPAAKKVVAPVEEDGDADDAEFLARLRGGK